MLPPLFFPHLPRTEPEFSLGLLGQRDWPRPARACERGAAVAEGNGAGSDHRLPATPQSSGLASAHSAETCGEAAARPPQAGMATGDGGCGRFLRGGRETRRRCEGLARTARRLGSEALGKGLEGGGGGREDGAGGRKGGALHRGKGKEVAEGEGREATRGRAGQEARLGGSGRRVGQLMPWCSLPQKVLD